MNVKRLILHKYVDSDSKSGPVAVENLGFRDFKRQNEEKGPSYETSTSKTPPPDPDKTCYFCPKLALIPPKKSRELACYKIYPVFFFVCWFFCSAFAKGLLFRFFSLLFWGAPPPQKILQEPAFEVGQEKNAALRGQARRSPKRTAGDGGLNKSCMGPCG